ncbi:DinB family protein [Pseudodesulfovibrio tunisiensis]|uniref:DinB family protein n=1 Tax=Pseudodesulfovibrio tunisiensis TaxID=463192 RepID=UPI001FB293A1|nr:DinB family protein [Pseudodesulfovibrio tunisiensis]
MQRSDARINVEAQAENLDEMRKDLLSSVEGLPLRVLNHCNAGHWSPLMVIEHLILAEQSVLREPFNDFSETLPSGASLLASLKCSGVGLALRWRIPVPLASPDMMPSGALPLGALASMWGENLAWLRQYAQQATNAELRYPNFHHPVAGQLTMEQALRLAVLHARAHEQQLARAVRHGLSAAQSCS